MNLLQGSELLRQSAQLGLRVAGLAFEDAEDDLDARKQLALVKLLLSVGRGQFGHEGMDVVHLGCYSVLSRHFTTGISWHVHTPSCRIFQSKIGSQPYPTQLPIMSLSLLIRSTSLP